MQFLPLHISYLFTMLLNSVIVLFKNLMEYGQYVNEFSGFF